MAHTPPLDRQASCRNVPYFGRCLHDGKSSASMTMAPSATMTSPKPSKPLHPPSKSLKGQGGQGRKWCSPGITRALCHMGMANQWRSPMGGTSVGLPMGLPVRVTSGGHQWGAPVGVTSGCHQRGVYQWAYQWGSPVGVYQWAYQWGSTLSRCWHALLAVRCLSLQRDAERFRKSSPRLSHYRLLAAPAAVSAPWRPHAPHMRPMLVDSGRRSQSK